MKQTRYTGVADRFRKDLVLRTGGDRRTARCTLQTEFRKEPGSAMTLSVTWRTLELGHGYQQKNLQRDGSGEKMR